MLPSRATVVPASIRTDVALIAPEPVLTLPLRLLIATSPAAVRVEVVLLIAPLVRSSIFPEVVWSDSLMRIGEVFVDDPTDIELGLLVKAIDEGSSNEVVADSLSKVVAYGLKTSGPDTLNVKFRLLFILSASKTSPPVTLNTVVLADMPRFPVAAPAAVLERITTAEDEVFVEVMVVVPPPPQALNSIVR
jgi:hypothetical protein